MKLPISDSLPIKYLAAVFNNTTNSYKFYWFLGILECLKKFNSKEIFIQDVLTEMIAEVWFPINYFKLSFGKQDRLEKLVISLKDELKLEKDISKDDLINHLKNKSNKELINQLLFDLKRYVPFRFLSPWYNESLRGLPDNNKNNIIYLSTNKNFNHPTERPIYKFSSERTKIILSKEWFDYLIIHLSIIKAFTFWHLINYLQKNNPNVPNLPEKLFPPLKRKLIVAKNYWQKYLENFKNVKCIYSNQVLSRDNICIDHYIPWSYVAHDQLWNLLPVISKVNSSKSNNIPSEIYLEKFLNLQFSAFQFSMKTNIISKKSLEDYSVIFNDTLNNIYSFKKKRFIEILSDNIKPNMQIAINMGFGANWVFN
ncbi:MAG: HNH endonuclease domain-containing protein [Ignavibacteriaceae bacterium]